MMNAVYEALSNRRSVRNYTGEAIPEEKLNQILQTGLKALTGKNTRCTEFIIVTEPSVLKEMVSCRTAGAQMLRDAGAAIIVLADSEKTDTWIEDGSCAMAYMHLMADALGLGSCWIQGHLRSNVEGRPTEEVLRERFGFPERYKLVATLALGIPAEHPGPHEDYDLAANGRIHRGRF